jgi:hypothetical protein
MCGGHRETIDGGGTKPRPQPPSPSLHRNKQKKPPDLQTDGPLNGNTKPPMDFIAEAPPIKVHGAVVASTGGEDPALGCPVEFIDLRGTSRENPAVCKYTGNKYYSDDWAHAH